MRSTVRLLRAAAQAQQPAVLLNVDAKGIASVTLNRPSQWNTFSDEVWLFIDCLNSHPAHTSHTYRTNNHSLSLYTCSFCLSHILFSSFFRWASIDNFVNMSKLPNIPVFLWVRFPRSHSCTSTLLLRRWSMIWIGPSKKFVAATLCEACSSKQAESFFALAPTWNGCRRAQTTVQSRTRLTLSVWVGSRKSMDWGDGATLCVDDGRSLCPSPRPMDTTPLSTPRAHIIYIYIYIFPAIHDGRAHIHLVELYIRYEIMAWDSQISRALASPGEMMNFLNTMPLPTVALVQVGKGVCNLHSYR